MEIFPQLVAGFEISTLPQQVVNGIMLGAIYALIALGYTMVYGVLKLINFAHGEVFMLGAYATLFTSYALGFTPAGNPGQSSLLVLSLMLLASMALCAIVGVLIERFAYRPMRNQPRIASLITAIGLSLLIQYGGQIFLPAPRNVLPAANPYQANVDIPPKAAGASTEQTRALETKVQEAKAAFDNHLKSNPNEDRFNLSPQGAELRTAFQNAERELRQAKEAGAKGGTGVTIPQGQVIMLVVTLALMAILRHLVLHTKQGRAMRAVSHDFNASSLMGINVNSIITFTFILGSALAGAGAMMYATFQPGTKIDPFMGLLPGVKAFVAAVLGGIGNIPGAVLGGLLMGVAETLVVWAGYSQYRDAVAFIILIVVLLFRPGGLLGSAKVEKV